MGEHELRISGIMPNSIVDGPGLRYVIFTQGCPHACPGCHNPATHDFKGGYLKDADEILQDIENDPTIDGITFSGGEPFMQPRVLAYMAEILKAKGYSIWSYSGFTIEQLVEKHDPDIDKLLKNIEVLVDGLFLIEQKSLMIKFRGSKNQRLIHVPKTLRRKKIVEWKERSK